MHRRARHLPFSLGSGANGAKLVLYAPALRGYADGDLVGTWNDISRQGNNATASGTQRPIFKKAIQGGMPVVRFVAANQTRLNLLNVIAATPATEMVMFSRTSPAVGIYSLIDKTYGGPAGPSWTVFGGNMYLVTGIVGNRYYQYPEANSSAAIFVATIESTPAASLRKNGNIINSNGSGAAALTTSNGYDAVGSDVSSGRWGNGDIGIIVHYLSIISEQLIARIEHSAAFAFKIPCN